MPRTQRSVGSPSPRRSRRKEVALLIETSNGYARGLLDGIIAYIREHESWSVYLGEHARGDDPPRWLRTWRGDGVIARIENQRIASAVVQSGLPAVEPTTAPSPRPRRATCSSATSASSRSAATTGSTGRGGAANTSGAPPRM